MTTPSAVEETPDVPAQVFESFLQALEDAGVPAEIIARLRKALLEKQAFTESALKTAVLGGESLP